jgi:integrase
VNDALSNDIDPTVEYIREQVRQKKVKKVEQLPFIGFFDFVEQYIESSKINKKKATITSYKSILKHLREFEKYSGEPLTFDSFGLQFYDGFNSYIIDKKGCGNNLFGKLIRTLKTFLNEAMERGYKVNSTFKSKKFKTISEDVESIYLNETEIKNILDLNLSYNPKLEKVRDLFVVGCFTGLRFSDFSEIKPENIRNECIYIRTIKTQQNVVIPFHPYVRDIMKKYEGKYPNNLPPAVSNQKMNEYLKDIGVLAKLNESIIMTRTKGSIRVETTYKKHELLTTHCARRSFATNLFKQGFPSISIMKITGHRTEKSFMKYIKVKEEEAAFMLKTHWDTYYKTSPAHLYKIA